MPASDQESQIQTNKKNAQNQKEEHGKIKANIKIRSQGMCPKVKAFDWD